ncbi:MAG: ADP-glyceromanno-heptose 6-epimerase, partial [Victivallales bacterium]|nr:ADP-glyceromanno-heptose 6-epimerase [Victivallales bacterium]
MYIVTGAAGLIGSSMIWELNRHGISDILAVDHLGTGDKWKNLRALQFADYLEKEEFRRLVREERLPDHLDAVIHLGACSSTTEKDATYLIDNNFHYTREVAQYCIDRGVRFLYASSSATYGDGAKGYDDDVARLQELRPMNMYGYSKQLFDLFARRQGWLDRITGLKFTNVYGPNEQHKGEMRSVVSKAYEQITATGKLQLFRSHRPDYRDGEQQRDFLYVKDAVRMVKFLLEHPQGYGIFNIGSGKAETWNALARAIFAAMDRPLQLEYIDMPPHLRDRYQYYTCAEMARLRHLGYREPLFSLDEAVADYIRIYR